MTWTAPMTAVANTTFNASQFNAHVRDNLLETFPGKASASGQYFVTTAANQIDTRSVRRSLVEVNETSASTSYTDLATLGPTITVTTGTKALVYLSANMTPGTNNGIVRASYAVSGATTIAANDQWAITLDGIPSTNACQFGSMHLVTLTAGSNTFTMKYRVGSGTGIWYRRHLTVIPL